MDKNLRIVMQRDRMDGNQESSLKHELTELLFACIADGNMEELNRILSIVQATQVKLTELTDPRTGKSCLMKALLNLNSNTNEIIEKLFAVAERDNCLKPLINAAYCDKDYKGQTALHIAIERRCLDIVKLLLEKGADVNIKANGKFFTPSRKNRSSFYFGELPLALAACTNQPEIVTLLLNHPGIKIGEQDSRGNTVLHALVTIADDTADNTKVVTEMYNKILIENKQSNLEDIKNVKGLTPLQLAAKLGKFEIFRSILGREMKDKEHMDLSRKITDWAYGPISSSLYDITGVDTFEKNSVLKVVVFNTKIQNRHLLLSVEPLNTLLQQKWEKFAVYMFAINFLLYVSYVITFTAIYFNWSHANKTDIMSTTPGQLHGQIFILIWAVALLFIEVASIIHLRLSDLQSIMTDAWFHILFFLQSGLAVLCTILNWAGVEFHLAIQVLAMALSWINILYYTRGFQSMGIYSVMLQKILLTDVVQFLFIYLLFLIGFGTALASLIQGCQDEEQCSAFTSFNTAILELFKLTIGLGDLEVQKQVKYPELFLFVLVLYVVLTFVLLLNMLIALMGETVENISKESKNIWKLQRARTILNLEKFLPKYLKEKFQLGKTFHGKRYIRIKEVNWTKWNTSLARINEDPGNDEEDDHTIHHSLRPRRTSFKRPLHLWGRRKWNHGSPTDRKQQQQHLQSNMEMICPQDASQI